MKYMLMMQLPLSFWKTSRMDLWPPQDAQDHIHYLQRLNRELVAAGEFVEVQGLLGPDDASVVHAKSDGTPAVTDGPFSEAKEFLAGYLIVDVTSRERAHAIAAQWSAGPGPGGRPLNLPVEVRPLMENHKKSG